MSQNFFAALDDSGDEAPSAVAKITKSSSGVSNVKAKSTGGDEDAKGGTIDPSKPDARRRPNQNDRNTKHGRGGRAPSRDGKRAYDRRSGTGRGKEIKKGGGGARNWGSDKDDAKRMEGAITEEEVKVEDEKITAAAVTDGEDAVEEEPAVEEATPEPEVDRTMTYAEYMASKGKKEEASGREVTNEFQGKAAAVKKEEEDFLVMSGGKQKKTKKKKEEEKKKVDVGFRVVNPNDDGGRGGGRSRGDRGGRGGGRDGRGGGRDGRGRGREGRGREGRGREGRGRGRDGRGGRGPKGGSNSDGYNKGPPQGLNVQDENAFPSL